MPEITLDLPGEILDKLGAISKDRNRVIQEAVQNYITNRFSLQKKMIEQSRLIHTAVKLKIAEKFPHLSRQRTEEEIIAEFDRICEKIQQKMKFETPEEAERFMRKNDYGLARY
jgi:metal-responsive CopG/Arc/MetJ family transcriptional regulator